jgi:hypothetical protein
LFESLPVGQDIGGGIERRGRRHPNGALGGDRSHQVKRFADRFFDANRFEGQLQVPRLDAADVENLVD